MKLHELKINEPFYKALAKGDKTFEVRKNDRDYQVGDLLTFSIKTRAMNATGDYNLYPSNKVWQVTYILTHSQFPLGVPEDYVVLGLRYLADTKSEAKWQ